MSERSNSVLVGAFVVGALVIASAGALFFAGGGFGGDRAKVVMVFNGSLHGLNVGAPVALRGVTVGQVTDIDLVLDTEAGDVTMSVEAEIDPSTMHTTGEVDEDSITEELVARGLRAQLNTQSLLTGLLYIQLDFFPDSSADLQPLASPYPQIPTIPTELEQFRKSLEALDIEKVTESIDQIAQGLDKLLNSEDMQALPGSLRSTLASLEAASVSINSVLGENQERLATLLDDGSNTLKTLNSELPQIADSAERAINRLDAALTSADNTLQRLEEAAAPTSPPRRQLSQAMHELSLAARALRSLARSLEEHPESLLRGRQETSE